MPQLCLECLACVEHLRLAFAVSYVRPTASINGSNQLCDFGTRDSNPCVHRYARSTCGAVVRHLCGEARRRTGDAHACNRLDSVLPKFTGVRCTEHVPPHRCEQRRSGKRLRPRPTIYARPAVRALGASGGGRSARVLFFEFAARAIGCKQSFARCVLIALKCVVLCNHCRETVESGR